MLAACLPSLINSVMVGNKHLYQILFRMISFKSEILILFHIISGLIKYFFPSITSYEIIKKIQLPCRAFLNPFVLNCTYRFQKVSEYDKEMPKSHTTDQPTAPRERDIEHNQPHAIKKYIE